MRRSMVVLILIVTGLAQPGMAAANEQTRNGGSLDDNGLGAWIEQHSSGRSGSVDVRRASGSAPSTWITISYAPSAAYGIACPLAAVRIVTRHHRDGTPSNVESVTCSAWPDGGPGSAAPFLAPTSAQVADAIDLPTSSPQINPRVRGLVGLETWFWYEDPLTQSLTVTLNGAQVTATAHAVGFEFATGDGAVYHSSSPGSESAPAARHVYQRHQTYTVTVTVIWEGSFTFVAPDSTVGNGSLGTVRTSASRAYQVVESQAVRTR